jgi:uncharacterized protein
VARLPRRPGQKEARYAQLLTGEPAPDADDAEGAREAPPRGGGDDERVAALEQALDALRAEVATLRAELDAFRAQFQ